MNSTESTRTSVPTIALIVPTKDEYEAMKIIWPQVDQSLFDEVLVIDGQSTDGTIEYCEEHGIRIIQQTGDGLSAAQVEALQYVTSDCIIMFSPDGNSLAEKLPELCDALRQGYDMVIVSRYKDGLTSEDDDAITGPANKLARFIINTLFGSSYSDALVIYRGYSREAVRRIGIETIKDEHWIRRFFWRMNSFEVVSSVRSARLKLNVHEIPGIEPERIGGARKMSLIKDGTGVLAEVAWDFLFFHPKK